MEKRIVVSGNSLQPAREFEYQSKSKTKFNLTAEKYCMEIQDLRGVSGSFYCVPNQGESQWGVQAKFRF